MFMAQHGIAALALASSGGHHHRGVIGLIVVVVIIAVVAFFLVRWARSRRDRASGKDGS
jgi:ABC-type nitrate/sulfonate/bicarbonate transport system permease component